MLTGAGQTEGDRLDMEGEAEIKRGEVMEEKDWHTVYSSDDGLGKKQLWCTEEEAAVVRSWRYKTVGIWFHMHEEPFEPGPNHLGIQVDFADGSMGMIGSLTLEKFLRKLCKKYGVILPPKGVK